MKQKYVIPTIEMIGSLLELSILAGSDGGGSGAPGGDSETPIIPGEQKPGGGTIYPGGSSSKEHNFNAWESWDEY